MKVKEEVTQLCLTLCDPMDYTVHGILQARILEWVAVPSSRRIFPTQGSNPGLPHCRWIRYQLSTREAQEYWSGWLIPSSAENTHTHNRILSSVQFSSVAQSCPTLCNPMNRSTPGLPIHHQLPEFTQTHVHRVSDAIQPFHPLSSPSPPAPNPSQHQSLFQ